ncbi:hypothetical protein [Burkholderia pyrrocinia]
MLATITLDIRQMTLSARDHYYSKLAPEENGQNYQRVHQRYLYEGREEPDYVRIFSHVPGHSNDMLIEHYVDELKSLVSPTIAAKLEGLFVAKRRTFFANAGAVHSKDEYTGDLVFFFVGLSDVLCQYAILFEQCNALTKARRSLGDDADETKRLFVRTCEDTHKLTEAQVDWGINRNEIRFTEESALLPSPEIAERAIGVAELMDKAVLRHEIAHHLLGHTGSGSSLSAELRPRIENLLNVSSYSAAHLREIEADLGATFLPASGPHQEDFDQLAFEVALGTLMAQTVLAQLKASIHLDAPSHPSWKVRHQLTLEALRYFYPVPGCEAAITMVSGFQAFLYGVQGRGLGELVPRLD